MHNPESYNVVLFFKGENPVKVSVAGIGPDGAMSKKTDFWYQQSKASGDKVEIIATGLSKKVAQRIAAQVSQEHNFEARVMNKPRVMQLNIPFIGEVTITRVKATFLPGVKND